MVERALLAALLLAPPLAALSQEAPVVTRAELLATDAASLRRALQMVRPEWLRGITNEDDKRVWVRLAGNGLHPSCRWTVWVDGRGYRRALNTIRTEDVSEVRYISDRSPRPDGTICNTERQALHVILEQP